MKSVINVNWWFWRRLRPNCLNTMSTIVCDFNASISTFIFLWQWFILWTSGVMKWKLHINIIQNTQTVLMNALIQHIDWTVNETQCSCSAFLENSPPFNWTSSSIVTYTQKKPHSDWIIFIGKTIFVEREREGVRLNSTRWYECDPNKHNNAWIECFLSPLHTHV